MMGLSLLLGFLFGALCGRSSHAFVVLLQGRPTTSRLTLKMANQEAILEAYRRKRGIMIDEAPPVPDIPELPSVPVEMTSPPVVVVVAVETPPAVPDDVLSSAASASDAMTPGSSEMDPISQLWRQASSPFQSIQVDIPKIPKDPQLPDVPLFMKDIKMPDVQDLKMPDVKLPDMKDIKVPDMKDLKLPDVKIPDMQDIQKMRLSDVKLPGLQDVKYFDDFKLPDSMKDFKLPDLSGVKIPKIPDRPDGVGLVYQGERIPTLWDLWKDQGLPADQDAVVSIFSGMQQSLLKIKENLLSTFDDASSSNTNNPMAIIFSQSQAPAVLDTLRDYGAWLVAGGIFCLWQVESQMQKQYFESQLQVANRKAEEAAQSATIAAQGATMAKQMAVQMTSTSNSNNKKSTDVILQQSKFHAMELEKMNMQKELEQLQQETLELKRQLNVVQKDTATVHGTMEQSPKKKEKVVLPRDPQEDERILKLIKTIDLENQDKPTTRKAPAKEKATPKKKVAKVVEKAVVETTTSPAKPLNETAFFVNVTTPEESAPAKKKMTVRKHVPAAPAPVATTGIDHPWSSLSPATLQRKTVKELTAYLSERGVPVDGGDGKPLKKGELVKAVKSLVEKVISA